MRKMGQKENNQLEDILEKANTDSEAREKLIEKLQCEYSNQNGSNNLTIFSFIAAHKPDQLKQIILLSEKYPDVKKMLVKMLVTAKPTPSHDAARYFVEKHHPGYIAKLQTLVLEDRLDGILQIIKSFNATKNQDKLREASTIAEELRNILSELKVVAQATKEMGAKNWEKMNPIMKKLDDLFNAVLKKHQDFFINPDSESRLASSAVVANPSEANTATPRPAWITQPMQASTTTKTTSHAHPEWTQTPTAEKKNDLCFSVNYTSGSKTSFSEGAGKNFGTPDKTDKLQIAGVNVEIHSWGVHRAIAVTLPSNKTDNKEAKQSFDKAKKAAKEYCEKEYSLLNHNCVTAVSAVLNALGVTSVSKDHIAPWELDRKIETHHNKNVGDYSDQKGAVAEFASAYQKRVDASSDIFRNQYWSQNVSRQGKGKKLILDEVVSHAHEKTTFGNFNRTNDTLVKDLKWATNEQGTLHATDQAPAGFKAALDKYHSKKNNSIEIARADGNSKNPEEKSECPINRTPT